MTDFVALDTDDLGVDRIATSPTAFALYDNLFAFAEKATGAPVLANDYIVTAMIANAQVTLGKMAASSVGASNLLTGSSEDAWVAARTAGVGAGAVGSYVLGRYGGGNISFGTTVAGSLITPANALGGIGGASPLSGTWRCMGTIIADTNPELTTLWLRIS
jgi:hypothetical protein